MNKRIRQIADEAGLRFTQLMSNPMVPVVDGKETDLEKFAELIVAECILMADKESERYSNLDQEYCSMAMDNYRELVRQHFGVE